ncbi:unnamed protein product, partial [Ectocarpus sp. 6 AP-2014]
MRYWLQTHGARCEHRTGGALLAMFAKLCPSFRFFGGGLSYGPASRQQVPKISDSFCRANSP